ncbi:MAG: hypothetical protein F6K54_25595 [Okeania sp. SIO3B5]|uniref:hypothetical protein n=1 Tax=Okeania sp. SIO3B5 TaxID=2607811 RepID=UPI0013FFE579|nr:hypothetical protein [Okeania sp. SIO3B5]NEO56152.1 hypothetical protein [Okeania sp. SIO3B5]
MNFQSVKPVRFLLAFIAFYFVAVPSFRLRQELERQALNTAWHQSLKEGTPKTQIFEDFIKDAQENLKEMVQNELLTRDDFILETTIPECNPQEGSPTISIRGREKKALFDCIRIPDFDTESKTDYKKRYEQSKQDIVVRQFDHIVRGQSSDLASKKGEDVSLEYSTIFIDNLTGDPNFLDRLPGFRIDTVYLFDEKNGVIAVYPGTQEGVYNNRRIDYRERPWYKSSISQYETVYLKNFSEDTSGLTGIFIDITDIVTPIAIRTLWYRFKDIDGNQYVLAFDMFFDETDPIVFSNSFLSFFWLSTPFEWMMLVLIALPSSLILSLLYEKLAKRFLPDTDSFSNLSGIRFTLIKEYYATLNDENISFNDTNVTISLSSVQTSKGVKLSLQGTGMEGNIERIAQQNRQEEKAYSYSFDHQYSLKVGPVRPTHKAVQIWQAEREPHLGKSHIVGHVVADWKTNNTVSSSGELSIKSIFWNKKEEVYLPSFQRQLRDHLLTGETGELTLVPDTQYQKRQSIPALLSDIDPDKLETVPELKQVIDNSFDLEQGRFFVSQLETVETLYALGNVKAIYSIPFVRKIITKGQHDFFMRTAMDTDREEFRFVLEHEAHHFKNKVYNHLNPDIQDDWKNESPFQIMVHQRSNTENVILEQEGFSLIYINNVLRFVLYSLSDDTYSGIGWVSWRKVDLEFFKTLYDYQRSKGNSLKTVKSYIEA